MSAAARRVRALLASASLAAAFAFTPVRATPSQPPAAQARAASAAQPIRIAFEVEPLTLESNAARLAEPMQAAMNKTLPFPVKVRISRSLRETLRGALAGEFDALWVPSTLAVAAVAGKRYELAGYDGKSTAIALLAAPDVSGFRGVERVTLMLPQDDSPASVVAAAMLSDRGVPVSSFHQVFTDGSYEVAAFAIDQRLSGLTAVPEPMAREFLAQHPSAGRILAVSPAIPGQTLVTRKGLDENVKARLDAWFATMQAGSPRLAQPLPAVFKYVTGLTHYTPDAPAGITKVDARAVQALAREGAVVVDVRTQNEFDAKHLPGARLQPYIENSPRILGTDLSKDLFEVDKLAGASRVVFYCNGPECWKSFKAVQVARASGRFSAIYWFRGGLPEWEREGMPVVAAGGR